MRALVFKASEKEIVLRFVKHSAPGPAEAMLLVYNSTEKYMHTGSQAP